MKKLLSTALALTMLTACIPLGASANFTDTNPNTIDLDIMLWYMRRFNKDPFTVTSDTFTYTTGGLGINLETDLVDAQYMVTDCCRNADGDVVKVILTPVNPLHGSRVYASSKEYLPTDLQIGDLITDCYGFTEECYPGRLSVEAPVTRLGNGMDIFGEDFAKVIRHEMIASGTYTWEDYDAYGLPFDIIPGDADEDEDLSILDVVKVNRHLMLGEPMICYAKLAADVNRDGVVDETDSLNILKAVLGILPDFAELTE